MTTPSNSNESRNSVRAMRVLVVGLVVVIVVLGLALLMLAIGRSVAPTIQPEQVNALARSDDECVVCHRRTTPGIVQQYGHSTMAAAEVSCRECHEVKADYPGALEHEGTHVLRTPTTAMCDKCHATEVAQFNQSRHGLPAYVAMWGTDDKPTRADLVIYTVTMLLLIGVGAVGSALHVKANLIAEGTIVGERFVRGAPVSGPPPVFKHGHVGPHRPARSC